MLSLFAAAAAGVCLAVPGSGTAQLWPTEDVVVGTYGRWTVRYTATEDFAGDGGVATIEIPS
ncbi:MAG: hypothetical protein JW952_07780, partial [Candidatus Eisenbacteria bacterium]|nr:hypothetical protein [Candidatus Eisenbacteria bacterium]